MNRSPFLLVLVGALMFVPCLRALADTLALHDPSAHRTLQIVRHYEIPAKPGKPTVAAIPAMMSFYGATNWQVIKSSRFQYGEQPDKVEITADNLGMPRRNYQLTWKAPKTDKIIVDQFLEVEISWFCTLYTSARLPYPASVLTQFADSLKADTNEGIDPDNKEIAPVCSQIVNRSHSAEEAVEGVCDWINENIRFEKGQRTMEEALSQRRGSCTPMSVIACAMLRHIGIPAEKVAAKFIGGESGHSFIEVFFPDAGWVFYDLSNWNRGFKSLDTLTATGWAYRSGPLKHPAWTNGYFCKEKDAIPFKDTSQYVSSVIRKSPTGMKVSGVRVVAQMAPPSLKPRMRPLRELIMDLSVPPGVRDFVKE